MDEEEKAVGIPIACIRLHHHPAASQHGVNDVLPHLLFHPVIEFFHDRCSQRIMKWGVRHKAVGYAKN